MFGRSFFAVATALLALFCAAARGEAAPVCRPSFVVPYAEECNYEHGTILKDRSIKNVAAAFQSCDRAQTAAGYCLASKTRQIHAVALSALYHDVAEQADIAMFAGQYRVAAALLREKLNILQIAGREAKAGDPAIERERADTRSDLAATVSGECTERAYITSGIARQFAHDRRYLDLEKTLLGESAQYDKCALLANTPQRKAYIRYISLVALEEAGRAAQAANVPSDAKRHFDDCIAGAASVKPHAATDTKAYLDVLGKLCMGRRDGTYRVDQPQPIDRDSGPFRPLALPKA